MAKIQKELYWKAFGKDITNMKMRENMRNMHMSTSDLFTNKMNINFNLFCVLMLDWIMREIDNINIITIDKSYFGDRTVKLQKEGCEANRIQKQY